SDNAWSNGCNDLAHEIDRLMNFYRYTLNNREQTFDSVILSGEVNQLEKVKAFLAERLGLPCELHPARRIPTIDLSLHLSDECKCSLAEYIGLALRRRK